MYSFPNFEPVYCSMSSSNCCFLTCIQISQEAVRWSDIPTSLRIFHILLWSTQSKALAWSMKQIFFWNSLAFSYDPTDVGNLISGSFAFSKSSLNIWKFSIHVLLKPVLEHFEHHFASMWNEFNCEVIWIFFGIAFLWDWNESWHFPVLALLSFSNLLAYWVQHFNSTIFYDLNSQLELHHLH